ncbi:hypothetical protein [Leuconostoc mesenteroides]|uniref:hypothetical protein n=1 Tax=Leuconostoc mesenteroides TaxID=1245 RepID=UPI003747C6F0
MSTTKGVVNFEKRVIVTTSRDYDSLKETIDAGTALTNKVLENSYQEIYEDHAQEWLKRWEKADVQIEGMMRAQGIRSISISQLTMVRPRNMDQKVHGKVGGARMGHEACHSVTGVADPRTSFNTF